MNLLDTRPPFAGINGEIPPEFKTLSTPCYLMDEAVLQHNAEVLGALQKRTGCKVLLAQKAFSNYDLYLIFAPHLAGTEASGLFEARLGAEEMPGGEVHVFCAAYREDEMDELLRYADHIVFNSPRQLQKFAPKAKAAGKSVGLRINPECSTQEGHEIYDPCAPGSRLGTTCAQWDKAVQEDAHLPELLDGLHFHTLCEQDADALETTLNAVASTFGDLLPKMQWLNFGGGHHITRPDYDMETLERCIHRAQQDWNVTVYLEPGEACALNAGYLLSRVLDVVRNGETTIAILDASAACHMPDVIEMPYRPPLLGAGGEAVHGAPCRPNLPCRRRYRRLQLRRCARGRRPARLRRYGNLHHLQKQYLQRHAPARHLFPHSGRRYPQVSVVRLQRFQIQARQPVNATAKAAVTLKLVSAAGWDRWFSSAVVNVLCDFTKYSATLQADVICRGYVGILLSARVMP